MKNLFFKGIALTLLTLFTIQQSKAASPYFNNIIYYNFSESVEECSHTYYNDFMFFKNPYVQSDPTATRILSQVEQKYRSLKTLQADFKLQIENADAGLGDLQEGKVYIKGDKYRILTGDLERLFDGRSIWTHFIEEEEVQVNTFNPEDGEINPATFSDIYKEDYTYFMSQEVNQNDTHYAVIDLTPNDKSLTYFKIRLWVNTQTNLIVKALVFEKNGTRISYELSNFEANNRLNDTDFSWHATQHPNVEIIDLR